MKILNKFIWSKKEPSNKNDIWFDGSTWRMYTEEAWQSFTLPVDAADTLTKMLENASEVFQEKLNAGYGIIIEGNTISVDDSILYDDSDVWEAIETLQQNKVEQIQLNDYVPLDRYSSTAQVLMDNISELNSTKADKTKTEQELNKKLNKTDVATINGQSLIEGGNIVIDDTEIKDKLTQLSEKVNDIADQEKTSEEDDAIVIEDNDGNKIVEINAEGADFKNLKSNGKPVATEQVEETESSAEEQVWMADDESEEYAKINKEGVHGKAFFFKAKNGENVNLAKVADNVSIHLSNIYGFVGDTIQVFFHSIIENYENYVIKVSCKYGKIYPKYYECTPSVECDEPLIMSVYTNNGVLLASKEVRLVATSAKNASTSKKILLIGASNVQNGEVAIEISRRLKGTSGVASSPSPMALSNYAITGRIKNADGSVGWEGIGGWRWDEYLGSAGNPGARLYVDGVTDINVGDRFKLEGFTQEFLISEKNITNGVGYVYATFYGQGDIYKNHSLMPTDGTMIKVVGSGVTSFAFSNARVESYQPLWNTDTNQWDILGYCNEHCGGAVHCICTQLGINSLGRDAFGSYADIADKVRLFLDRTHSQMPNCIILLGKIMLPSQMGGLGKDYTTNDQFGNYNAEGFNVKIHQYNAILESIANEEKYSSFVKVVDLCSQFDAVNNYPTFEKQVNTRNPQKEELGGNGVHPNNYGYWQVADAWVRAIINVVK